MIGELRLYIISGDRSGQLAGADCQGDSLTVVYRVGEKGREVGVQNIGPKEPRAAEDEKETVARCSLEAAGLQEDLCCSRTSTFWAFWRVYPLLAYAKARRRGQRSSAAPQRPIE